MPWMVNPQPETNCFELSLEGAVDHNELHETRQKIHQLLEERSFKYALVDMQKINWCMSTVKIHELAEAVQHPLHMQIAIVCRADDWNAQFFAMVAGNRERQIQVFTDYEEAKEAVVA